MAGVLIAAAFTATSYFVRSSHWGIIHGASPDGREAIGFPWLMWEEGNTYGGYFVDLLPFALNLGAGLVCAAAFGWATWLYRVKLDEWERRVLESIPPRAAHPPQISLRGLLVAMGISAFVAVAARWALSGRPEVLGLIYAIGPWLLVGLAFIPLGLQWQQRVVLIVPITLLLMGAAIGVGRQLRPPVDFDKVLLGIFVSWTPQAVVVSVVIGIIGAVQLARGKPLRAI